MMYQKAMLAEATDVDRLIALCHDANRAGEQKVDGDRLLVHVDEGKVHCMSRTHRPLNCGRIIPKAFDSFVGTGIRWVFDGEYLDGHYYVFDLIEAGDIVTPQHKFSERRAVLEKFLGKADLPPCVTLLPSYPDVEGKLNLALTVRREKGEGLVFKRLDAPYIGKRSTDILKVKFRKEIDCVVSELGRDGKANMVLVVYDADGKTVEISECTALAGDKDRIQVGDVVTVTYLYAQEENRRLVQPTLPRIRHDKLPSECTIDQLVFTSKRVFL